MDSLPSVLHHYCKQSGTLFHEQHADGFTVRRDPERQSRFDASLLSFFKSTMDETRLAHSRIVADALLWITDLDDATYFRDAVLRRELTRYVSYQKHRDHSAHTLNNYILGWYILDKSAALQREFQLAVSKRSLSDWPWVFQHVWPHVSLLHDVGYIFEGSCDNDDEYRSAHVSAGTKVVKDFFDHVFWIESGMSLVDRDLVRELIGEARGRFGMTKITEVAADLRRQPSALPPLAPADSDPDAFALWEGHFREFKQDRMAENVRTASQVFERILIDGLGVNGPRILDHGVCSALLLLLHSTLWYTVHHHLCVASVPNELHGAKKRFLARLGAQHGITFSADHWWKKIVWATGACMIHNVLQLGEKNYPKRAERIPPLTASDDPLAFLGILVDCLQEWDRYQIAPNSVWSGELPLQGVDVALSVDRGRVIVRYPDDRWAQRVKTSLTSSLSGWGDYLDVT